MSSSTLSRLPIGYLGPATTNTHVAALEMFGGAAEYQEYPTVSAIFNAVTSGTIERGVVPIENSIEGVVRDTVDCLLAQTPVIEREHEITIQHCLLAPPGLSREQAQAIVSHPQALAQCRLWLDAHYPELKRRTATSTAAAARDSAEERHFAIASELAAKTYGLTILARGIADRKNNATRFICISNRDAEPTGNDKTTIVFTTPHERGALRKILTILDDAGVNLTRIESRPLPERRWEYAFVVDIEGHRSTTPVREALSRLHETQSILKVLGSYPKGKTVALEPERVSPSPP